METQDLNKAHAEAMEEVQKANASGINIHGKLYTTVATRAQIFRKHFGVNARMRIAEFTENDNRLYMRAVIELLNASRGAWVEVAEGRAEEIRGSSNITKTSAVEVCETSAYGRALANFGLHGGEFASANEVEGAIKKQKSFSDRSGRPDTSNVDPEQKEQYAQGFINALLRGEDDKIMELHNELRTQAELYTAVSDSLSSKQRSDLRAIIQAHTSGRIRRPAKKVA